MPTEEETTAPVLQPWQRRLVGATIVVLCLSVLGAAFIGIILTLGNIISTFSHVLWPLAVAGILALMLRPLARGLEQRLKISPVISVVLLYGMVIIAGTAVAAILLPVLFHQISDLIRYAPSIAADLRGYLESRWGDQLATLEEALAIGDWQENMEEIIREGVHLAESALPFLLTAGEKLFQFITFLTGLAILPIYLFFFLKSDKEPTADLERQLSFLPTGLRHDLIFLAREFINIILSFFRGQLIIALIMGVLLSIGFAIFGLKFSVLLGLTLGLLNIIPYLGTILGFVLTIPLALFQPEGGWEVALGVVGVFVAVQALESWFLTPRIMGQRTGLHPVMVIIAIFFWGTALGGLLGMILAIPLTAFFVIFWRLLRQKYLPHPDSTPA